jgi:hypothetical protein
VGLFWPLDPAPVGLAHSIRPNFGVYLARNDDKRDTRDMMLAIALALTVALVGADFLAFPKDRKRWMASRTP